jgi:hypothetical protein
MGSRLKPPQKPGVRGGEGIAVQIRPLDPSKILAADGPGFVSNEAAQEEPEPHVLLRIPVTDRRPAATHRHLDAQFLEEFSLKAGLEGLLDLALAPGEFPKPAQVIAVPALGD